MKTMNETKNVVIDDQNEKKEQEISVAECVLDAYFLRQEDSGRWTSQDICDNVRDTIALTPDEVTQYMLNHRYHLERQDDRLVWVKYM